MGSHARSAGDDTSADDVRATSAGRVSIRSIALPTEHGGWGFTLEPILLGLLVAPSVAAWGIAAAALGVFLARRPLKLVSTDVVRGRWLPRSGVALTVALAYGAVALGGALAAFMTADGPFWIPVLAAVPLALVALRADAHSANRTLIAELAGAMSMGATVSAIAVAGGWDLAPALGLWLILAARDVASITLVRGQIRRLHGRPTQRASIYTVQGAAVGVVAIAAAAGIVPWLGVFAVVVVAAVAVVSLNRAPVAAKVVGWTQMATGLAVVLITAVGVALGI